MGHICSLMETTIRQMAGDKGLPMGLAASALADATLTQGERLHVECRGK